MTTLTPNRTGMADDEPAEDVGAHQEPRLYPIVTVLKVNMYELGLTKPWTFLLQARAPFWWTTQTQAAMIHGPLLDVEVDLLALLLVRRLQRLLQQARPGPGSRSSRGWCCRSAGPGRSGSAAGGSPSRRR